MFRELVSVYMLAHARRQHEHEQGEHRQEDQASCGAMSGPAQTSQYRCAHARLLIRLQQDLNGLRLMPQHDHMRQHAGRQA